jgi:hypothetical protein
MRKRSQLFVFEQATGYFKSLGKSTHTPFDFKERSWKTAGWTFLSEGILDIPRGIENGGEQVW